MKKLVCLLGLAIIMNVCAAQDEVVCPDGKRHAVKWRGSGIAEDPCTDVYAFMDKSGDMKIVLKKGDLYIERLDGSGSRKITHTPNIAEKKAYFSKDGKYVCYISLKEEVSDWRKPDNYTWYIQSIEEDDSQRREVSEAEFLAFIEKE